MTFTSDHPTTIYSIGIEEDLGSNRYFKGNVGNNEDLTYQRNWIDFAGPISALAFDALRFENDFAVVLYDGDTRVGLYGAPSLPREDYPYFVGLVSDVPFTRAEIACDGCGYRLDDVSIPVPEPNTAMLLAAGLLMLGSARRT